jgi:hypothetical protein
MLEANRERILAELPDSAVVLDVGAWAKPFARADWVIDLLPYETRGLYGYEGRVSEGERFTTDTWVSRDICAREPWPFADDQFDFAICSHTLEDVRDPIWVCSELERVAKAGYVEVPSRLEEQTYHVQGPWVGWGHHHWLIDVVDGGLEFVFKHEIVEHEANHFPAAFWRTLSSERRVVTLWWEDRLPARERFFMEADALEAYLREPLMRHASEVPRERSPLRRILSPRPRS